ncbi:hypothetical protein FNW52_04705 [Flavobacterium sp. ZT3R18]|uniref:hypothetical protein n=1 Tax=Flavobacterium sp. ZT3R18 TaxID=2594429 RepID=UPI00117A9CD9|nr:hypothetical protein [Flavobacterium sp. ZT3R18]TRX37266.1 hypothetical protein FNW52_04705 [Flavobacterium sp. ZT3R18]
MKAFKLENEPRIKSGFKTPEGYHGTFSSKFLENLPKEEITNNVKVVSIYRKRKTILIAIAAVLVLAIMIPTLYTAETKNNELDSATIENYLAEESNINQYELIGETELESNKIVNSTKLEDETLEDILVTNPNIENLVIEN